MTADERQTYAVQPGQRVFEHRTFLILGGGGLGEIGAKEVQASCVTRALAPRCECGQFYLAWSPSTIARAWADDLDAAIRQGAAVDKPEGTRWVQFSDTVVRQLAALLRTLADGQR